MSHAARLVPLFSLLSALGVAGLLSSCSDVRSARPAARPTETVDARDVQSITQLVSDFYSAISAPAGGTLDRGRLQALFVDGGRIATALPPRGSGPARVVFRSVDEYAEGSDRFTASSGFFDRVLHNRIEKFGYMAHVYSAYESRANPSDERPLARGIKSFELLQRGDRWLIVQVYWDSERPDNPIPPEYLGGHSPQA